MPKIVVEEGSQKGAVYNFRARKAITAGRGEICDIIIHDNHASRQHFVIEKRKDNFFLRDLGSTNGTLLNDTLADSDQLRSGDKIRVGQTLFTFLDEEEKDPLIGQNVGGYLLHERVGKGGMGTVYMASQLSMARVVAIKILSGKFEDTRDFVNSFISEARAAGRMNHPNIVQVHDVGKADNVYYYSMEFMKNGSIQDMLMHRRRMSYEEAIPMIIDAARGLEFAESRNIIHRDIKPDNLMLAANNTVKICDLGLAEVLSEEQEEGKREIVGSPHYMSPEQASGDPLDHRTDIYSLGATFYRILAGKTPYSGRTPREIIGKVISEDPAPLKDVGVPRAVAQIVEKMMAKDLEQRYQNATAAIADIEKLRAKPKSIVLDRPKRAKGKGKIKAKVKRRRAGLGRQAVTGLVIAIVVVLGLIVAYLMLAPGRVRPDMDEHLPLEQPAAGIVFPDLQREQLADEANLALKKAREYEEAHSDDWESVIKVYRDVKQRYPEEDAAVEAKKAIDALDARKASYHNDAKQAYVKAQEDADSLLVKHKYGEAGTLFLDMAKKYSDTQWAKGAQGRADHILNDAKDAYNTIVAESEELIAAGKTQEARDRYAWVMGTFGYNEIVKDAKRRFDKIGEAAKDGAKTEEIESALQQSEEMIRSRAFGDAQKKLSDISLEGIPGNIATSVKRRHTEAKLLDTLKQKLIAAINTKVLGDDQMVTIKKDLRGVLVRANESSVAVKTAGSGTVESWSDVSLEFIRFLASKTDLGPEDELALGMMCVREDKPGWALIHINRARSKESLKGICDFMSKRAQDMLNEKKENK